MISIRRLIISTLALLNGLSCGQDDLDIPEPKAVGACGDYYPGAGSDDTSENELKIEEGKIFPCIAFETARLAGEDTYIHIADEYLKAKHGVTGYRSIIIVVSADRCPGCAALMEEVNERAEEFEAAGTLFIGAVWCDNLDLDDCDFDIDKTEIVLESEGWPLDKWPITNDEEEHLRKEFGEVYPSVIVTRLNDMRVMLIDYGPSADTLLELVETFPAVGE
jgi:hypothetical protein